MIDQGSLDYVAAVRREMEADDALLYATPPLCGKVAVPSGDHAARKATPIYTGVLKYFPDALAEIARVSKAGNDQHNPGQPLHWAKGKSTDHEDCIVRHLCDHARGDLVDSDGQLHLAKAAWRALAALQTYIENADVIENAEVEP